MRDIIIEAYNDAVAAAYGAIRSRCPVELATAADLLAKTSPSEEYFDNPAITQHKTLTHHVEFYRAQERDDDFLNALFDEFADNHDMDLDDDDAASFARSCVNNYGSSFLVYQEARGSFPGGECTAGGIASAWNIIRDQIKFAKK